LGCDWRHGEICEVADTEKHVISIFPQHFRQEFKEGDEVFVTWCLMMEVQLFMAQKYPQIDFTFNKEVALVLKLEWMPQERFLATLLCSRSSSRLCNVGGFQKLACI